jgi:hypothetical protein
MKSIIDQNIGRRATGYVVNTGLNLTLQHKVGLLQNQLSEAFPGVFWLPAGDKLHVTLMDWLAPLVNYGADKDELFGEICDRYIKELASILSNQRPIRLTFDEIVASPGAIFIKASDDGSYSRIRSIFTDQIELIEGTKQPPQIIHASIARFHKAVDLQKVIDLVNTMKLDEMQVVEDFRLVRESVAPMLEYRVVSDFKLRVPDPEA